MARRIENGPGKKRILLWFMAGVLLLEFYVLSVGPLVRLATKGYLPRTKLYQLHTPLRFLADVCPPIDELFRWYIDLWLS